VQSIAQLGVNLLDALAIDSDISAMRRLGANAAVPCLAEQNTLALGVQGLLTSAALGAVQGAVANQEPISVGTGGASFQGNAIQLDAATVRSDAASYSTAAGVRVSLPHSSSQRNASDDTSSVLVAQFSALYCQNTATDTALLLEISSAEQVQQVQLLNSSSSGLATPQVSIDFARNGEVLVVADRPQGERVRIELPLEATLPAELATLPLVAPGAGAQAAAGLGLRAALSLDSVGERFELQCPFNNTLPNPYANGPVNVTAPCLAGEQVALCGKAEGGANITVVCGTQAVTAGCMFFDEKILQFSSRGCTLVGVTAASIVCECSHLTTFAGRFSGLVTSNRRTVLAGSGRLADIADQAGQVRSVDDLVGLVANNEPFVLIAVAGMWLLYVVLLCITCNLDARQQKAFLHFLSMDEEVMFLKHVHRLAGDEFRLVEHLTAQEEAALAKDPVALAMAQEAADTTQQNNAIGYSEPLLLGMACPSSQACMAPRWYSCADTVLCGWQCSKAHKQAAITEPGKQACSITQDASLNASSLGSPAASPGLVQPAPSASAKAVALPSPSATASSNDGQVSSKKLYLRVAQVYRGVSLSGLSIGDLSSVEQHVELHPHFSAGGDNTLTSKREAIDEEASTQPASADSCWAAFAGQCGLVARTALLRIRYQHNYWNVCTKFDFQLSRAKRLTLLYMSLMIAMAGAAVFYDVQHPEEGDELPLEETIAFAVMAACLQLPVAIVLAQLLLWAAAAEFDNTYQQLSKEIRDRRRLEKQMKLAQREARLPEQLAAANAAELEGSGAAVSQLDLTAVVHVERRLRWDLVLCMKSRVSCALTQCCADASASAFEDPEHPNDSDVDSDDDQQYGWVDAPPFCLVQCAPMLRCCGRHPSQRAAWLRRAREADFGPHGCCWAGGADDSVLLKQPVVQVWQRRQGGELSQLGRASAARMQMRLLGRAGAVAAGPAVNDDELQGMADNAVTVFLQNIALGCHCRRQQVLGLHTEASEEERAAAAEVWAQLTDPSRRQSSTVLSKPETSMLAAQHGPLPNIVWATSACQRACPLLATRACLAAHCCCVRGTARGNPVSALRGWESVIAWAFTAVVFAGLLSYVLIFGLGRGSDTLRVFLLAFVISQATAMFVVQPLVITLGVLWALVLFPALSDALSWVPGVGALLAPPGAGSGSEASTLSGRLQHVSLVQAAGAASGLSAENSLLAFGVVGSLSSAMFGGLGRWRRSMTARAVASSERAAARGDSTLADAYSAWQDSRCALPAVGRSAPAPGDEEAPQAQSNPLAAHMPSSPLPATCLAPSDRSEQRVPFPPGQRSAGARALPGGVDYRALPAAQVARMVFSGRLPPPSSASNLRHQTQLVVAYLSRHCSPDVLRTMAERYARATCDAEADELQRAVKYFVGGGQEPPAHPACSASEAPIQAVGSADGVIAPAAAEDGLVPEGLEAEQLQVAHAGTADESSDTDDALPLPDSSLLSSEQELSEPLTSDDVEVWIGSESGADSDDQ